MWGIIVDGFFQSLISEGLCLTSGQGGVRGLFEADYSARLVFFLGGRPYKRGADRIPVHGSAVEKNVSRNLFLRNVTTGRFFVRRVKTILKEALEITNFLQRLLKESGSEGSCLLSSVV